MTLDDNDKRYRAPALDKGLDILEILAVQPGGMTRGEIVKAIGKSPSEIYRMIERLVARNYVSRSIEGDRYALTMKLFHIGAAYPPMQRLVRRTQSLMDNFAIRSMQAIHLVVPDMGQAHVVARASSRATWEFRLRVGAVLGLLETSSGQTLLAFQDEEHAARMLQSAPGENNVIPTNMATEFAAIRNNGYRIGASQQLVGVTDISVPIKSAHGLTVAVLTCPFLTRVDMLPDETDILELDDALTLLLEMAELVSVD